MKKDWITKILLLAGVIYTLYQGYNYAYPLYEKIVNPPTPAYLSIAVVIINSDDLISAGMDLITTLSLGLMLLLILIPRLIERNQIINVHKKFTAIGIFSGVLFSIIIIIGVLLYTDPRGYYETGHYEPRISQARRIKLEAYADYPQQPDLVILGSSHSELVDADYISEISGLDAFNASIAGGSAEFQVPILKYFRENDNNTLPSVLVIEVFPPLGTQLELKYVPSRLIPYLDRANMRKAIEERGTALFNLQHLSEAIYVYVSQTIYGAPPPQTVLENGTNPNGHTAIRSPEGFEKFIERDIQTFFPGVCPNDRLLPAGEAAIDEIIKIAHETDTSIIFYRTALHPRYYDSRVASVPRVLKCYEIFDNQFETLAQENPNIFYLDFIQPDSFGGLLDNQGWLDAHHMTVQNSNLLFEAALPTIEEAYAWAQDARNAD